MLFENLIWECNGRPQGANPTIRRACVRRTSRIVGLAPCGRPLGLLPSYFINVHHRVLLAANRQQGRDASVPTTTSQAQT